MPVYFHTSLSEKFICADREVTVSIAGFHVDTGRTIWDVAWSSPPTRMRSSDMALFDRCKAAAMATLTRRLAELQERST